MTHFDVLSLFPEYFRGPLNESILKRAQDQGVIDINLVDIRNFADNAYRQVDDRPYGGGPGMVLMPGPVTEAIRSVRRNTSHVIYLSPQGAPLTAKLSRELAEYQHLILLCGHYEGIDQRVIDREVDREVSIGDYVLTNGCLPAIVLMDAVARFVPGVLGHADAAAEDSFEEGLNGLLDCPHYTRPEVYEGQQAPEVLRSGNHAKIEKWRHAASMKKTETMRPDLYVRYLAQKQVENTGNQKHHTNAHIATLRMAVYDLKKSLRFYRDRLGLPIVAKGPGYIVCQLGNQKLFLIESALPPTDAMQPVFEMHFDDMEDFMTLAGRLLEKGTIHVESREHELKIRETMTVEVCDPDGHHWCLKCKEIHENTRI